MVSLGNGGSNLVEPDELKDLVSLRLARIESLLCDGLGLGMDKLTLVARDPGRAEMFIVFTNDDDLGEVIGLLAKENGQVSNLPLRGG